MNSSNQTTGNITPNSGELAQKKSSAPQEQNSMESYYRLVQTLLLVTLGFTGIVFFLVWLFYSLNIALNYLLGACGGVAYLRLLGREVASLGVGKKRVGFNRLAIFIGLIIVATQWQQLQIMPIFLGFMTYKAAIIFYMLQNLFTPANK